MEVEDSEFSEGKELFWVFFVLPAWTNQDIHKLQKEDKDIAVVLHWLEAEDVPQHCPPNSVPVDPKEKSTA